MPIVGDAKKVLKDMKERYGEKEGERVFYATANKQNRVPETWQKKESQAMTTKCETLKALLQKRAARRTEEDDDDEPGLGYHILGGALGGGAAGAGIGALSGVAPVGLGELRERHYRRRTGSGGDPGQWRAADDRLYHAYQDLPDRLKTHTLTGAGVGAATGVLMNLLTRRRGQ